MPKVTGYNNGANSYRDFVICKWQISGTDYTDTVNNANKACISIGLSNLWSTGSFDVGIYLATEEAMIKKYIGSASCYG